MTGCMNETMELYRDVFSTTNEAARLVDVTPGAALEAVLAGLIQPADIVLAVILRPSEMPRRSLRQFPSVSRRTPEVSRRAPEISRRAPER